MWMLKDNARLLVLLTLSLLLLFFAVLWRCSTADAAEIARPAAQEQTVQVPLSKLKELQSLMNSQEQKINLLEQQLNAPTSELQKQEKLISELQSSLKEAKSSLDKSELIISEQNKSLTSLSEKLKQDARREQRIKRQRLLWQIVAGGVTVALVRKAA